MVHEVDGPPLITLFRPPNASQKSYFEEMTASNAHLKAIVPNPTRSDSFETVRLESCRNFSPKWKDPLHVSAILSHSKKLHFLNSDVSCQYSIVILETGGNVRLPLRE